LAGAGYLPIANNIPENNLVNLFAGLAASLSITFFIGACIPVLIYQPNITDFTMIGVGKLLSIIFVVLAMLAAIKTKDKAKAIGGAVIMLGLYFSLLLTGLFCSCYFNLQTIRCRSQ